MDGPPSTSAEILPTRHKFSVDDTLAMEQAGLFAPEARIELIDGELIDMAPIGPGHGTGLNSLNEALVLACAGRAIVWVQSTVRLSATDAPQPDFAVLRRRPDFYAGVHPGPADILLLIEMSDSTLRFDQTVKLPRYARAGIPECWIVDLSARTLHAHRNPSPAGYAPPTTHKPGERLALHAAPAIAVPLDIVFP